MKGKTGGGSQKTVGGPVPETLQKGALAQVQEVSLGVQVSRNPHISTCGSKRGAWQTQSDRDSNATA